MKLCVFVPRAAPRSFEEPRSIGPSAGGDDTGSNAKDEV